MSRLSKNVLHMGNGHNTDSDCFVVVRELIDLFSELSGIQQMHLGPNTMSDDAIEDAVSDYLVKAGAFIRNTEKKLGLS